MKKILIVTLVLCASFIGRAQIITTVAGNGTAGYSGDGGAATNAEFWYPLGVAIDATGNVYIADYGNNRVRKVNSSGVINTVAGDSTGGFSGDGGAATMAELWNPMAVAVDLGGNLYISDYNNYRIRKVSPTGIISTIAGNGSVGFSGDGGPATAAELSNPTGVAVDGSGNVFIVDQANGRIRKVNTSGIINTIAGTGVAGFTGDGGPATDAELNAPYGIAVDGSGNVYIADLDNLRIRQINTSGVINTVAGIGTVAYGGDGGPATAAGFLPEAVAVDVSGNLYIADGNYCRIRKVNNSGIISTIAGNGVSGYSGDYGLATSAELSGPYGVAVNGSGEVFITDNGNNRIRKVSCCTVGVEDIFEHSAAIQIYPNPADDLLTVKSSGSMLQVSICNLLGLPVVEAKGAAGELEVNIASLPASMYLVKVNDKWVGEFVKR